MYIYAINSTIYYIESIVRMRRPSGFGAFILVYIGYIYIYILNLFMITLYMVINDNKLHWPLENLSVGVSFMRDLLD